MKNREEGSKHFFDSGPLVEEDEDIALYDRVRLSHVFSIYATHVSVFVTILMSTNCCCFKLLALVEARLQLICHIFMLNVPVNVNVVCIYLNMGRNIE